MQRLNNDEMDDDQLVLFERDNEIPVEAVRKRKNHCRLPLH